MKNFMVVASVLFLVLLPVPAIATGEYALADAATQAQVSAIVQIMDDYRNFDTLDNTDPANSEVLHQQMLDRLTVEVESIKNA